MISGSLEVERNEQEKHRTTLVCGVELRTSHRTLGIIRAVHKQGHDFQVITSNGSYTVSDTFCVLSALSCDAFEPIGQCVFTVDIKKRRLGCEFE